MYEEMKGDRRKEDFDATCMDTERYMSKITINGYRTIVHCIE